MDHLTEGELQAWLDRELEGARRARVARHLETCVACRRLASDLRAAAEAFSAAMLDYDAALDSDAGDAALADSGLAGAAPADAAGAGPSFLRSLPAWVTRAAAVVLLLGGAAAAAMVPGSPLRALFEPSAPEPEAPPTATVPEAAARPEVVAGARIAVRPEAGRLTVRITGFADGTRVVVALSDREDAVASLPEGAPDARFVVASGTLEVVGADAPANELNGAVYVWLPRSLEAGALELDGRVVAQVTAGRLITLRQVSRTGDEAVFEIGG